MLAYHGKRRLPVSPGEILANLLESGCLCGVCLLHGRVDRARLLALGLGLFDLLAQFIDLANSVLHGVGVRVVGGGHAGKFHHLLLGKAALGKRGLGRGFDLGTAVVSRHGTLELLLVGPRLGIGLHADAHGVAGDR